MFVGRSADFPLLPVRNTSASLGPSHLDFIWSSSVVLQSVNLQNISVFERTLIQLRPKKSFIPAWVLPW